MDNVEIIQEEILKNLGGSITEFKSDILKVQKDEIDKIIESKILNFEQKKETLEKIKLLQLFGSEYLSYITAPAKQSAQRFIYGAKEIFEIENESDFKIKMEKLDEILNMCKYVAMHPFDSTKDKIQQKNHQAEIYKNGGKF